MFYFPYTAKVAATFWVVIARKYLGFITSSRTIWATALLFVSASALCAQPENDRDNFVALIIDLAPWGYRENKQAKGFYTDLAKGLVRTYSENHPHRELELLIVPYSRAKQYLNQIPNSFTIMTDTSDIENYAYSAGSLFELDVIAIPKPGLEIKTTKDLTYLNILKIRGTSLAPKIRGQVLMETSNALAQLNMLFKNRADVIIGVPQDYAYASTEFTCPHQLKHPGCLDTQRRKALLIRQADVHVWVGKNTEIGFLEALSETVFHFKLSQDFHLLAAQIEAFR